MSERVTHILRAMAVNYLRADVFDTLDSQALHKAADQIDALHAEAEALRAENAKLRAALAEQGERQEVVVPAKRTGATGFAKGIEDGWNAAIDAVMRLNATPQPGPDVRALVEALREVAASLAWNCFGECRAVHDGPIMPAAMALDMARTALATYHQDTQPCPTP